MSELNTTEELLEKTSVRSLVLRLGIPAMFGQFFNMLYSIGPDLCRTDPRNGRDRSCRYRRMHSGIDGSYRIRLYGRDRRCLFYEYQPGTEESSAGKRNLREQSALIFLHCKSKAKAGTPIKRNMAIFYHRYLSKNKTGSRYVSRPYQVSFR